MVLADIDQAALDSTRGGVRQARSARTPCAASSSTSPRKMRSSPPSREACVEFGGLDILVSNAGIASLGADRGHRRWRCGTSNIDILATGYFLVSREAFRLFRRQELGGYVVFVASKNGLAASPNASAYCTAKAAEMHLARCLALEGARGRHPRQRRQSRRRAARLEDLERRVARAARRRLQDRAWTSSRSIYRKRSMLKLNVFPEDIAEAVYFLASDLSAKSTGNIINVDAGNAQSFTR